jgi:hypothetical protein
VEFPNNYEPSLPIIIARTFCSYRKTLRVTLKAMKQPEFFRLSQKWFVAPTFSGFVNV